MENALRATPLDIREQYERQIKALREEATYQLYRLAAGPRRACLLRMAHL